MIPQNDYDFVLPPEGFSVYARAEEFLGKDGKTITSLTKFKGYVYLSTNLVFEWEQDAVDYPAGIEDFANCTLRNFSERLLNLTSRTQLWRY